MQKLFQFIFLSLYLNEEAELWNVWDRFQVGSGAVVFSLSIYSCFYWKLVDLGDKLLSLNKSFLGCIWHVASRTWWSVEWNVNFHFLRPWLFKGVGLYVCQGVTSKRFHEGKNTNSRQNNPKLTISRIADGMRGGDRQWRGDIILVTAFNFPHTRHWAPNILWPRRDGSRGVMDRLGSF